MDAGMHAWLFLTDFCKPMNWNQSCKFCKRLRISNFQLYIKVSQLLLPCGLCGSGVLGLTSSGWFSQTSCIAAYARPFFVPCTTCIRFSAISLIMPMGSQYVGNVWDMVRRSA